MEDRGPQDAASASTSCGYEYRDHTADIQIHSWGVHLAQAFEQAALGMFNYMTPLNGLARVPTQERRITASGHDMKSLLFNVRISCCILPISLFSLSLFLSLSLFPLHLLPSMNREDIGVGAEFVRDTLVSLAPFHLASNHTRIIVDFAVSG